MHRAGRRGRPALFIPLKPRRGPMDAVNLAYYEVPGIVSQELGRL
jgi:hypothetical protein